MEQDTDERNMYDELVAQWNVVAKAIDEEIDIQVIHALIKGIEFHVAKLAKTGNGYTG